MKTLTQLSAQVLEKAQELNHQQMENVIGGSEQQPECSIKCFNQRSAKGLSYLTQDECLRLLPQACGIDGGYCDCPQ